MYTATIRSNVPDSQLRCAYDAAVADIKSLNRSRGQFIARARKAEALAASYKDQVTELIQQAAISEAEKALILAKLAERNDLFRQFEDIGDELVSGYDEYKSGATFQGGRHIGSLVSAVIRFVNLWKQTKGNNNTLPGV